MQIDIRTTNIELPEDVRSIGERRALFAFGRFASRIRNVSVVLTDVNGPRGGVDTRCRVQVTGRDGWKVNVTDVDDDIARAVTCTIARAGRAVARQLERARGSARRHRAAS